MTSDRWIEIKEQYASGASLANIDCDEDELFDYIEQLRDELAKEDDEA